MTNEKLLIEIYSPATSKAYDFVVPRKISAKALCQRAAEDIGEQEGVQIWEDGKTALFSQRLGRLLYSNLTMEQEHIDSGDTLYLI